MKLQKPAHSHSVEEIYESMQTSDEGLGSEEIEHRRQEYGRNKLKEEGKKSLFSIFISQVNNPVIYLLLAAMTVSFIFGDIPEAIAIIIVIILNTVIGFWMEYRAQASLDALKKLDPLTSRVIREGKDQEIQAEELVPGDLIQLEAGDIVPADARIVSASELSVDESPLTGESLPVDKQTDPVDESVQVADRTSMLFKGTALSTGKARAVVTDTGMETEIGNISRMVGEAGEDEIPLNRKLGKLSRRLIWIIGGLAVAFLIFGWITGKEIYLLLQTAIAWTVAAIPEGLPIVATISLARGMLQLAEKNVLVRNLSSVETLGETTMILTDKTGTITKNELTLDELELASGKTQEDTADDGYRHFYRIAVLCNDAGRDNGGFRGDPLDAALLTYGHEQDQTRFGELRNLERINEDPFDSGSMMMGTIHGLEESCYISVKGATKAILNICTHYFDGDAKKKLDDDFREKWIR
ncbi:MAG: HAD-IC family P-type ATPase, partial [Bacteroidales bacterium]|nr:HAD-IC family P-type ATPase [Bacteroidales bacterium]